MVLPKIPERDIVVEYMDEKKVNNEVIKEFLHGLTQKFLKAIQEKDEETVRGLAEKNFAEKIVAKMGSSDSGFEFKAVPIDPDNVQIVDKLLIRGLGIDRSTNDSNMDYIRVTKFERQGLRQFVHKYMLGL